jgi:hypothetical protein
MANFFDASTGAGITSLTVTMGSKFKIGLYGGDGVGKRLNVTTAPQTGGDGNANDPAVELNEDRGDWNLIYEIDSNRIKSPIVRACWNGADYSAPVTLNMRSTSGFGKAAVRKSIVDLARSFVRNAHYLWGTAGNRPPLSDGNVGGGKSGAAKMRAYSLSKTNSDRDNVLGVCMAVQDRFDGYNTCAGRAGVRPSPPADLDQFLSECQRRIDAGQLSQTEWPGAGPSNSLYPRKYHFKGVLQANGAVIWGESCNGVPHFDCVGLVNYCYAKHWDQASFGVGIEVYKDPKILSTVQITNAQDRMDADILIPKGATNHIGMLYNSGGTWLIVQAVGTTVGLTEDAVFNPESWDRYRLPDDHLKA